MVTGAHDDGCPLSVHSAAAYRASDAVNLHLVGAGFDAVRRWVAVRLDDGASDGTLYDTKRDAVRHQLHEQLCAYVQITPSAMSPCAAESLLGTHRKLYDAGWRLVDPDHQAGGRDLIPRVTREEQVRQVAALLVR